MRAHPQGSALFPRLFSTAYFLIHDFFHGRLRFSWIPWKDNLRKIKGLGLKMPPSTNPRSFACVLTFQPLPFPAPLQVSKMPPLLHQSASEPGAQDRPKAQQQRARQRKHQVHENRGLDIDRRRGGALRRQGGGRGSGAPEKPYKPSGARRPSTMHAQQIAPPDAPCAVLEGCVKGREPGVSGLAPPAPAAIAHLVRDRRAAAAGRPSGPGRPCLCSCVCLCCVCVQQLVDQVSSCRSCTWCAAAGPGSHFLEEESTAVLVAKPSRDPPAARNRPGPGESQRDTCPRSRLGCAPISLRETGTPGYAGVNPVKSKPGTPVCN